MIYEIGKHKISVEEIDKEQGIYKVGFLKEEAQEEAQEEAIPSGFHREGLYQMIRKDKHSRFVLKPLDEHGQSAYAFEGFVADQPDGYSIAHREKVYELDVSDPRKKSLNMLSGGGGNEIKSQMPGRILAVNVGIGDCVEKGDVVLVMEAMKMENPLKAPSSGVISDILIAADDLVDAKQVLVKLSPQ